MGSWFLDQGWNLCPPALVASSLNHWTTRETPSFFHERVIAVSSLRCRPKKKNLPPEIIMLLGFPDGPTVQNLPAMQETQETQVQSPGREDPLEEGTAAHSSTLAWRLPWTEEPGGPQSAGSQRVGHG